MLVKFRHGIVKQQKDIAGNPASIFIDGNVFRLKGTKEQPFVFTLSFGKFDYLLEVENSNLTWPIRDGSWNLYLSMDLLTGELSTGSSSLPVFYTDNEPQNVEEGQHWFDVNDATMRVFEDGIWKDVLRIFVARAMGQKLTQMKVGSQMVTETPVKPVYPVLDTFGYPMRVRRPKDSVGQMSGFMGSTTKDLSKGRTLVRFGDFLLGATASTNLHSHCLVHLEPAKKVRFSDATDPTNRVIGMVIPPASSGQEVDIKSFGFIKNENWNWSDGEISRPLFSDGSGNPTTLPPDTGILQQVGFVVASDTMFLDIKRPVILTLPRKAYSFVPGALVPSTLVSYVKDKKFVGGEISIDFETEPLKIFSGDGLSVDLETQPQLIFAPSDPISFSYEVQNLNIFAAGSDILFSFGIEDLYKFSAGKEIQLLDFEDYNQRTFSGEKGSIIEFNASLSNVLTPDNVQSLIGLTIFDLYTFNPGTEPDVIAFEQSNTNIFVPSSDIIFTITTQDRNVLLGNFSGQFTYATVSRNIFGTTPIEQRISFIGGSGTKIFTYGTLRQLFSFNTTS